MDDEWMSGWMSGWMDEWLDERMDPFTKLTYKRMATNMSQYVTNLHKYVKVILASVECKRQIIRMIKSQSGRIIRFSRDCHSIIHTFHKRFSWLAGLRR